MHHFQVTGHHLKDILLRAMEMEEMEEIVDYQIQTDWIDRVIDLAISHPMTEEILKLLEILVDSWKEAELIGQGPVPILRRDGLLNRLVRIKWPTSS
jgi:hypothetical protein